MSIEIITQNDKIEFKNLLEQTFNTEITKGDKKPIVVGIEYYNDIVQQIKTYNKETGYLYGTYEIVELKDRDSSHVAIEDFKEYLLEYHKEELITEEILDSVEANLIAEYNDSIYFCYNDKHLILEEV